MGASLAIEVVDQLRFDRPIDIFRHRVADLFGDVSHCSQGSSNQSKGLGYLPRQSHVKRDSADGSGHIRGQGPSKLRFRRLANTLKKIAVAAIHTRLTRDLEQTH